MRPIIRKRILDRFNNKCVHCGSIKKLQIDHIIPVSRGGREDENNMQILCKTCNLKKGKGVDFDKFIKVEKDCIYISNDFPIYAIRPDELKHLITTRLGGYND